MTKFEDDELTKLVRIRASKTKPGTVCTVAQFLGFSSDQEGVAIALRRALDTGESVMDGSGLQPGLLITITPVAN
jgi:translation initiation factor 1 (eIF-1/SUI1)